VKLFRIIFILALHLERIEIIFLTNLIAIVNFMKQKWIVDAEYLILK
jgi:hypothetical protein